MTEFDPIDARAIRITFNNGQKRSFAFEPKDIDPSMIASNFQKHIDQGYIALELDDRVIVAPIGSIQTIEIAPRPEGSLPNAVRVLHEFGD